MSVNAGRANRGRTCESRYKCAQTVRRDRKRQAERLRRHVTGPNARSQAKWLELSSNAKQLFSDKSSGYIPFDQPNIVVDSIPAVYTQDKQ